MKLPFDLGLKLLFRLLLPGFVLTLGLSPLVFFILDWVSWAESHTYILIIVIVLSGWLLLILDMPIYMLFEGRRFWFDRIRRSFVKREQERLRDLAARSALAKLDLIEANEEALKKLTGLAREQLQDKIDNDERDYIEANFDIRDFPMNSEGEYYAKFPTRLGNLIHAYENYSTRFYGMDTMFYWPRIWLKLDKDLREEIDNRQAITDSTVYVALASFVGGVLWVFYGVLLILNWLIIKVAGSVLFVPMHTLFEHLPRWWIVWGIAFLFFLTGFLVYRISLPLHAQFGEIFKSVFDVYHDVINVTGIVGDVADYAADFSLLAQPKKNHMEIAFGYLQFGLINCPECGARCPFGKLKEHMETHNQPPADTNRMP
jgi:hypothetical protein